MGWDVRDTPGGQCSTGDGKHSICNPNAVECAHTRDIAVLVSIHTEPQPHTPHATTFKHTPNPRAPSLPEHTHLSCARRC